MKSEPKPTKEILDNWHSNPNNWKWGCIYYNKVDKRIFPPKRNKYMGWTVNFANPISILALIIVCVTLILISKYLKSL